MGMRMTNLRGSRRFRKMVLHKRQNFRAAATKESHLVFKLRKAWLRLHKALQCCRRMMRMHVTLRKSGQAKQAQRLSQETRRLTILVHKEEEKNSLLLKHQRLWTSERVRKWSVKLIKQMKKAHEVTTALDLKIKSAKFEKKREKKGWHRYKDRLENIEYHVNALRRERVLLTKMIETMAREIKKDTTPALMLKTISTRLSKIEASMQKLVGDERAKLVKGVQAEHNNRREVPKKGFGLKVRLEKKRWDALSHDVALVRKELGKSMQQHYNQLKLLNQLRHERLLKSEVVEKLKKIGSELRIIHIKLAKVHNRRPKRRFQRDDEQARHLLFLLRENHVLKGKFTFRVNKVRMKIKAAMEKLFSMRRAERNLRRVLAEMRREVRSKTVGASRQFWKLSSWHHQKTISAHELLRQQKKLTSEISRRGRARKNLRALKLLRVKHVWLLRKLRNKMAKHAKEVAALSGRKRTSAADNVARSRRFLSTIMTAHIRHSNMLRDLQRMKKGMLLLSKRFMRERTKHAQEENYRHMVWRKANSASSEEAHLKREIVAVGMLTRRLNKVRLKFSLKHHRVIKLLKKIEREIRFLGRQIEKSRGVVEFLTNQANVKEHESKTRRDLKRVGRMISASRERERKLSQKIKRARWLFTKKMTKKAKTLLRLKKLRDLEVKIYQSMKKERRVHMRKAGMPRLMRQLNDKRSHLLLVLNSEEMRIRNVVERLKMYVVQQTRELNASRLQAHKLVWRLTGQEGSASSTGKVLKKNIKKLRWQVDLTRRNLATVQSALDRLYRRKSGDKRSLGKMIIRGSYLHNRLDAILAEIRRLEHEEATRKASERRNVHLLHLRIHGLEVQLKEERQVQDNARKLLQRSGSHMRAAHANTRQLTMTLKQIQRHPQEKVHILEEKENKHLRKVHHIRSQRGKLKAKLRRMQKKLLKKSGMVAKLKAVEMWEFRMSSAQERRLFQKLKHGEAKVKRILRHLKTTKRRKMALEKEVKEEVRRVAHELSNLNSEISDYSRKSHKWASLKRSLRAAPLSKKISTQVRNEEKHRSAELRATLNATRKLVKKIVKKLKNVVARSLKAEDVKTKLAKAYKLKLSQYLLLMAKLQNQKRSVGKMLVVLGARRSRTGQKLATERKIHNTVDERYRVTMSRQVHSLRSRERKLLRLLNGESARFTNKMAILNRNARALSRIKERMLHVSELELKESEKKLAQSENRLRVQIKTASALIAQARRASRFQKAGLAKETETEHRKGMKVVAHLGRLRKAVEGQVRSHQRGNLKKLSSEKSRLQHLMVIVAKDSKNLAKKRKLMAKQFSKKIKHVAKQSIKAIVRERKWRKWLTATLQREVSQTQGHHNKERQIVRGEKTYAHIIQGLKAMIQGEHGLYNKMSKMLHGAKVKKQRLEFFKHEISKKTRQSGKQQAWRLREMEKLKWGMHGILQRLLKAHSQVKHVLSALKAEKIKGEVRLVYTIKRIKNTRFAAHLRALWTSGLNKYKVARAKLYKQLMHKNMLLAKEIKLTGKKMEQQSGQTKRRTRMEIDRKHAIGYMKARIERYAAHLKEQRLKILKRKKNNDASTQQFEERKAKTLRMFKRERVGGAINAEKLREEPGTCTGS